MIKVNDNYGKLQGSYLFSEIARRVDAYTAQNPDKELIRLGIEQLHKEQKEQKQAAGHDTGHN